MLAPPDGAAAALEKRTHWRVYKKPPTIEGLRDEPDGVVLTALATRETRVLLVKLGAGRWLDTRGTTYAECVDAWRAGKTVVDEAAVTALIPNILYTWCINRMYAVPAAAAKPRKKPTAKAKTKRR